MRGAVAAFIPGSLAGHSPDRGLSGAARRTLRKLVEHSRNIVTAQRREETVQNVPLSITALSERVLEEQAVARFFDYAVKCRARLWLYGDGSGTARTISIRGISGDGATGFYIDETPVPDSIDPRVVDLQRIEALRGPKVLSHGARSMGGTVRLITQQPNLSNFEGLGQANGSHTLTRIRRTTDSMPQSTCR